MGRCFVASPQDDSTKAFVKEWNSCKLCKLSIFECVQYHTFLTNLDYVCETSWSAIWLLWLMLYSDAETDANYWYDCGIWLICDNYIIHLLSRILLPTRKRILLGYYLGTNVFVLIAQLFLFSLLNMFKVCVPTHQLLPQVISTIPIFLSIIVYFLWLFVVLCYL